MAEAEVVGLEDENESEIQQNETPQLSSLSNPTWEFLHENFTKGDLQKHCRQLGLAGIWTTKEKLIDKIIEHSRSGVATVSLPPPQNSPESTESETPSPKQLLQRMETFMNEINGKFEVLKGGRKQEINIFKEFTL